MTGLALILARLERPKQHGKGYRARCPCDAHKGTRSDTLVVTEVEDRILLFCFGGCATGDVLAAIGLTVSDLFEPRPKDLTPEKRIELREAARVAAAYAAVPVLMMESQYVGIAAARMATGEQLTEPQRMRLARSVELLADAYLKLAR